MNGEISVEATEHGDVCMQRDAFFVKLSKR